jgi:hypothetical protein
MLGTQVQYRGSSLSWNGKTVRVISSKTTNVSAGQFALENAGGSGGGSVNFTSLRINNQNVREFTLEHPNVDLGCGTIGLPGDHLLLKSSSTVLFSACAVWFELKRV